MESLNPDDLVAKPDGGGFSFKRLIPIVVLLTGLGLLFAFGVQDYLTLDALRDHRETLTGWVDRYGVAAGAVYALVYAVVIAFSVPGGAFMTMVGGFLFGPWLGTVYTVIGASIGAMALFLAARYAFADLLRQRAGSSIHKMEDGFNRDAFSYLLFLRLVPVFPFWLVNLVPALLNVRFRVYLLATVIGIIPGCFVYSLAGDGLGAVIEAGKDLDLGIIFEPRFLAPIVALALFSLVPIVYRHWRRRRS